MTACPDGEINVNSATPFPLLVWKISDSLLISFAVKPVSEITIGHTSPFPEAFTV